VRRSTSIPRAKLQNAKRRITSSVLPRHSRVIRSVRCKFRHRAAARGPFPAFFTAGRSDDRTEPITSQEAVAWHTPTRRSPASTARPRSRSRRGTKNFTQRKGLQTNRSDAHPVARTVDNSAGIRRQAPLWALPAAHHEAAANRSTPVRGPRARDERAAPATGAAPEDGAGVRVVILIAAGGTPIAELAGTGSAPLTQPATTVRAATPRPAWPAVKTPLSRQTRVTALSSARTATAR